jgi:transcriptional regulator with XRE-family HTH domain
MTDNIPSAEDVGIDLAKIREMSGMSQQKLGEKLGADASRISRIESGKIKLNAAEADKQLRAIGTPIATFYRKYGLLDWKKLPQPSFWHPDWEVLYAADGALARLDKLAATLPPGNPLLPQLDMHRQSLFIAAKFLESTQHDLAFIGETGVGKTFALCWLTGLVLELSDAERLADRMVLEVGQGWTTLCEVRIQRGPRYGLVIDPLGENELRALVRDFRAALADEDDDEDDDSGGRGVSEEVDRALRNLMDLAIQEHRDSDGKITHYTDPIVELRKSFTTPEELQAELFNRIRLHDRTKTQVWQDEAPGKAPKVWLKKVYEDVNNGLRPDVPLPGRIDVVMPDDPIGDSPYRIRLIDTKGLDKTAIRRDIQDRLDDPRTLLVLCTRFSSFAVSLQGLIEHARNTGATHALNHRIVLLALPQKDEAVSMKTPLRKLVESDEQGYDLNLLRLKPKLERLSASHVPVLHLNALRETDVRAVTGQLQRFIKQIRESHGRQIESVDAVVKDLAEHHQEAVSQAAHAEVRRQLANFLKRLDALPPQGKPVYMALLAAVRNLHYRTVQASVVRHGNWPNLNVYLYLGAGTATDAQARSAKFFTQLEGLIEQLLVDGNLAPAHGFLRQLAENAERWRARFLEIARRRGEELLREPLFEDHDLWGHCAAERGRGYRDRVADVLQEQGFQSPDRKELLTVLESHVQREWEGNVLDQFRKLCMT